MHSFLYFKLKVTQMSKRNFYIVFVLVFTACANYSNSTSEPFQVLTANYNHWTGGQPGVKGIKIIIALEVEKHTEFQKIFFQRRSCSIELQTINDKKYLVGNLNTSKLPGDELVVQNKQSTNNNQKTEFPFKLKEDQVAISYLQNGQIKYYLIQNIKETSKEFYP